MQVDANGIVWAAGPRGLWRYDPANQQLRLFGTQDGLISVEFNDAPLVQRADGTLFGATLAGIVGFAPDRLAENAQAPRLVLDEASVTRDGHAVALDLAQPIVLGWTDRNLTFDARALSYANPAGNRYQWKLDGYDADWIDAAPSRRARVLAIARRRLHVARACRERERRLDRTGARDRPSRRRRRRG